MGESRPWRFGDSTIPLNGFPAFNPSVCTIAIERTAFPRIYPWGTEAEPERMNFSETGVGRTSAVGSFPGGVAPYGNEEMSGNVWEWTRSIYEGYPYPKQREKRQQREDLTAVGRRVLRGGSFGDNQVNVRCAARNYAGSDYRLNYYGFRIVLSPL